MPLFSTRSHPKVPPLRERCRRTGPVPRGALALLLAGAGAMAGTASAANAAVASDEETPPNAAARQVIAQFLATQTAGLPGAVSLDIELKASRPLPHCKAMTAFLPRGSAAMGRLSVGLRCNDAMPWTRFVSTYVSVEGRYLEAARAIEAGQPVAAADLVEKTGDLSRLPRSVLLAGASVAGTFAVSRIGTGTPLRKEMVRGAVVVRQGQTVDLVAQGVGFTIRTEGVAMTAGQAGALVRAKSSDGRVFSGIADKDGAVLLGSAQAVPATVSPTP